MTAIAWALQKQVGIRRGQLCGRPEWELFQSHLGGNYDLIVYSKEYANALSYKGNAEATKRIIIYHSGTHYYLVRNLAAMLGCRRVCWICLKPARENHVCKDACRYCASNPPCERTTPTLCSQCNLLLPSPLCHAAHTHRCGFVRRCHHCGIEHAQQGSHKCGLYRCKTCATMVEKGHECFMKPVTLGPVFEDQKFVFYD